MVDKFKIKRVGNPSPYVSHELRCVFAVETAQSFNAPAVDQCLELETMLLDSDTDTDERCFTNWHGRYMAKISAAREALKRRKEGA